MKKIDKAVKCTLIIILSINYLSARGQLSADVETGAVITGYNDVRIPGDIGTLFSLKDDLTPKTEVYLRLRATYTIKSRHSLSLLYAPLETTSEGAVPYDILFEGVTFPANTDLTGTYKFNSYRLTYRYAIVLRENFEFGLGFTAKIRDAKITLANSALYSEKTNVGFVPVINFMMHWSLSDKFGILLEGDALAAPQGRAEDVQIAATYRISNTLRLRAGYRILEGGADNNEVYNFALFNYASAGLTIYL